MNFEPNFKVMFLPPNCIAILQNVNVTYSKQLLQHILSEYADNVDVVKTLKMFSLKDAVYFLDLA